MANYGFDGRNKRVPPPETPKYLLKKATGQLYVWTPALEGKPGLVPVSIDSDGDIGSIRVTETETIEQREPKTINCSYREQRAQLRAQVYEWCYRGFDHKYDFGSKKNRLGLKASAWRQGSILKILEDSVKLEENLSFNRDSAKPEEKLFIDRDKIRDMRADAMLYRLSAEEHKRQYTTAWQTSGQIKRAEMDFAKLRETVTKMNAHSMENGFLSGMLKGMENSNRPAQFDELRKEHVIGGRNIAAEQYWFGFDWASARIGKKHISPTDTD